MERLFKTQGRMGGLIRGMHLVLTLNEPAFLLPFSGSETLSTKYRAMPRFQRELMSERAK